MTQKEKLQNFLQAVEKKGLAEDLGRAARHHSAANVKDGDQILQNMQKTSD
ncbi:MAG: hypothetical protein Q4G36_00255 [Paracoccus sp. (in: a-proteobacteria)]|nr:hypothetical protein [Paracoccus sp. (in: a-proteobacteria)]